jgi:hypothetical protein
VLDDCEQDEQRRKNVVLITKFAVAMQLQLAEISKDAFYEYKLRIGNYSIDIICLFW